MLHVHVRYNNYIDCMHNESNICLCIQYLGVEMESCVSDPTHVQKLLQHNMIYCSNNFYFQTYALVKALFSELDMKIFYS